MKRTGSSIEAVQRVRDEGAERGRSAPSSPPEEAALAVARKLGPKGIAKLKAAEAAEAAAPAMTAAEAHAAAAAEGLELLRADNKTGFRGTCSQPAPSGEAVPR